MVVHVRVENMDSISKEQYNKILSSFGLMFNCEISLFSQPGITIIRDRSSDDRLHIWYVNKRVIIWSDKSLVEKFTRFAKFFGTTRTPEVQDFLEYYKDEGLTIDVTSSIHILDSKEFTPYHVKSEFLIKQLTEKDTNDLKELHDSCTFEDVDEAYVEIDHPIIMGAYFQEKLVAASSVTTYWGNFSDLGVLTHPDYRGLGLAKAVVSAACEKII